MTCEECGTAISLRSGRVPRYCSGACRQRAYRQRRKQGPQQPALPDLFHQRRWARADGKRPIQRDGSPASTTDPDTWTMLGDARDGAGDGLGVMLGSGLGCYDLDGALVDGRVTDDAREIIASIEEPIVYSEISVSGNGLHIFITAPERRGMRRPGVERYTRARFIRTTFQEFSM